MPHFARLTGRHLILLLLEDDWKIESERSGFVILIKGNKHIGITEHFPQPVKRVTAICQANDITTSRFEELLARALAKHDAESPTPRVH
jgi:hypothetical protein